MSLYAGGWSSRSCLEWGLGVLGMMVNEDEDEDEVRDSLRGEGNQEHLGDEDVSSENDEEVPSMFKKTISSI